MQELLIATGNPGKFSEMMEVLEGLPYTFLFLGDLGIEADDFEEDGDTFEDNALKKAKYFSEKTGLLALGEDSGILVNALPGELGVKTRRWGAGEFASDEEWIEYFMKKMEGVEDRGARFVCTSCVFGDGVEQFFSGETRGTITSELMAPILPGLPLSSCFISDGFETVYASMTPEEKNQVSHRGKAMHQVRAHLGGMEMGGL